MFTSICAAVYSHKTHTSQKSEQSRLSCHTGLSHMRHKLTSTGGFDCHGVKRPCVTATGGFDCHGVKRPCVTATGGFDCHGVYRPCVTSTGGFD